MPENALSQVDAGNGSAPGTARGFWDRLVEPAFPLPEDSRRRARLFAWLLLAFLPLVGLAIASFFALYPAAVRQSYPSFAAAGGTASILVAAYFLNRIGRYTAAAQLTIAAVSLGLWTVIVTSRTKPETVSALLPLVIICVLLSSILLSLRATAVVAGAHIAMSLLALMSIPGLKTVAVVSLLVFVNFTIALLVIVAALWRQGQKNLERQARELEDDVAERKYVAAALAEERNLLRAVIDNVPDYIYVKDAQSRFVLANRAVAQAMAAAAPDELLGKTDFDYFTRELAEQYHADEEAVMRSGQSLVGREEPLSDLADERRWTLTTKVPWRDSLGNIIGIVGVGRDITERKRTAQALQEAEAKYRTLVEQIPAVIYIFAHDQTASTLYISPQVQAMLGYPPEEWLADPDMWNRLLHPEDRERALAENARHHEAGEPLMLEYRLLARDGRTVWIRDEAVIVRNKVGQARWSQGIMMDITERKRAEEALHKSEERFQLVARATNDAVWDRDLLTDEEWWNEGLQKLFDYPRDHVGPEASWWSERVHPDDRERVVRSIEAASRGGEQSWSDEYRFRRADGLYADVFDRGHILRDDYGRALRMIGAMMDVTDRKRAEEALREAEEKYRSLVEQLPAVVYVAGFGEAAPWSYVSPQIQSLLGYSPQEWVADPALWHRQLHPEDRDRVMAVETLDHQTGAPGSIEYRMMARDGRLVWVRDEAVVVRGLDGVPTAYHGVIVDITERKRTEGALQEAHERLTQWLKESERRSREIGLLNEMSGQLQACVTEAEAYNVIAPLARHLFPEETGALCVTGASRNLVEVVAVWNAPDKEINPRLFAADDCWAMRRGRTYLFSRNGSNVPCGHVSGTPPAAYLCVPLMAQGEALGMLHMRSVSEEPDLVWMRSMERKRQLTQTVADNIALALANLRLRESLRYQSIRDPLTGLFNRRYMEETLEREVRRAARGQRPLGVILMDLDMFKDFNDTYGHAAGDALLRELGKLFTSRIRAEDVACRYGGEEFLIIMPEASLEVTRHRAEQLLEGVRRLEPQLGGLFLGTVTASFGVAVFPEHGPTGAAVIRVADEALYSAKREGRDRVAVARSIDAW